ncbi:MAG: hypothetical protein AAGA30_12660, partial [Planctomycetota bacterium]
MKSESITTVNHREVSQEKLVDLWSGRFLSYLLIFAFILGCAYFETVLIPRAIEANQKINEYKQTSSVSSLEAIATQESVRNSSWIMA